MTPYRYITPVPKRAATGQVAAVYAQMARDFILADGPLMSLSPAPEVLAAAWALVREAQVSGRAPRADKELVAVAISAVNQCPFCVGAHTTLVHATGEHEAAEAAWRGGTPASAAQAAVVAWARATARAGSAELPMPPFPPALAVEYLGTALATHFINRMTSVLLNEAVLARTLQGSSVVRRLAGSAMARRVRRGVKRGESIPLVPEVAGTNIPRWGEDTSIGYVYGALAAVAAVGGDVLSRPARCVVQGTLADWEGELPGLNRSWLEEPVAQLPVADRAGARLALLAAVAPYRITDADVSAWRGANSDADIPAWRGGRSDADLVRLLAYGAMSAVDRIQAWTTASWSPSCGAAGVGGLREAR